MSIHQRFRTALLAERKASRQQWGEKMPLCFMGTTDYRLMDDLFCSAEDVLVVRGRCGGPEGTMGNFDGAWIMEDPTLPDGVFRWEYREYPAAEPAGVK